MRTQDARSVGVHASAAMDELERDLDTEEMDELDEKEGDEIEIAGEEEHEGGGDEFPYGSPRTLGPLEPVAKVADKVERQLRDRPLTSNVILFARPPRQWQW